MRTLRQALTAFVHKVALGSPSLAPRAPEAVALIDHMTAGWGDRAPDGPPFVSYFARDGTPFEPSVRIARGRPSDLRWGLEAQPADAARTAVAYFAAARALDDRLAALGLADLTHVRRIEDIFAAHLPRTTAAIWFGVALGPGAPPLIKNYFIASRADQWREAFRRFGLSALAQDLAATVAPASKVELVCLDLLPSPSPRIKLYVRHRGFDPEAIDASHALSPHYRKGDAALLATALFGEIPVVRKLGPISTFHIDTARGAITHSTICVPLEPLHYASPVPADDTTIALAIGRFVSALGLPIDPLYPHTLACALDDGVVYPHHRYCGLQRCGPRPDDLELTVYLSTLLQARRHGFAYGPLRLGPESPRSPGR